MVRVVMPLDSMLLTVVTQAQQTGDFGLFDPFGDVNYCRNPH